MPQLAVLLITILLSETVSAKEENWLSGWQEKETTSNGISSKCRTHKTKINECSFKLTSDLPLNALVAINTDAPNLYKWMSNTTSTTRVDPSPSKKDYHVYTTFNFPGMQGRDAFTRTRVKHNPQDNSISVAFRTSNEPAETKKLTRYIRFQAIQGEWIFTPLANGKTGIQYTNIGLPAGTIQSVLEVGLGLPTLYNIGSFDASLSTIRSMLKKAREPEYMNASIDFVTRNKASDNTVP